MSMAVEIYTGQWTDWAQGPVRGMIITLSARDGGFLLASLATFVAIVAARLWRILNFVIHQSLASEGSHDGLHHQRQVILRNNSSPMGAVWLFLTQAWYWRGIASRAGRRTLPLVLYGLLYLAVSAVLAIFSSQISDAASEFRLVKVQDCGLFVPETYELAHEKASFDNQHASIYAQQCYQNQSVGCNSLPVQSLPWVKENMDCPFADSICINVPALKMETLELDSRTHLGINDHDSNRISYKRETVCSPLVTQPGFSEFVEGAEAEEMGWPDKVLIKYFYGHRVVSAYTHLYNTYGGQMMTGYNVWTYTSYASESVNSWEPNSELSLEARDTTLMLLAPNSVFNIKPNDDPVFRANDSQEIDGTTYYFPSRYVSPIACVDRHQVCNPLKNLCTEMKGSRQIPEAAREPSMEMNSYQLATVERLSFEIGKSTFYDQIWTRSQSFLKAQDRVANLIQLPLPDNQWEIEMAALFETTLAKLQNRMQEYATGPAAPIKGSRVQVWDPSKMEGLGSGFGSAYDEKTAAAHGQMCHKQLTRMSNGTLNFSVLGLALTLTLGSLIIICSLTMDLVVGWIQRRSGKGVNKARRWEQDDDLQIMRLLCESKGMGDWAGETGHFPRTTTGQVFEYNVGGEGNVYYVNDSHIGTMSTKGRADLK